MNLAADTSLCNTGSPHRPSHLPCLHLHHRHNRNRIPGSRQFLDKITRTSSSAASYIRQPLGLEPSTHFHHKLVVGHAEWRVVQVRQSVDRGICNQLSIEQPPPAKMERRIKYISGGAH